MNVTNSVDVFSMGCCFNFALTGLDLFNGEWNDRPNYSPLEVNLDKWQFPLAQDLISKMVRPKPSERISAKQVIDHQFFWDEQKIINFLEAVSKYLFNPNNKKTREGFDRRSEFYKGDWKKKVHKAIKANLDGETFKSGSGSSAADLIRAFRNSVSYLKFKFGISITKYFLLLFSALSLRGRSQ